ICIQVSHRHDLTDLGVGITRGPRGREGSEECAAARAPTQIGFLGVPVRQGYLLRGAQSLQGHHDTRGLALETDAPDDATCRTTDEPTHETAKLLTTGIGILIDDVGHQYTVYGLHLAL